jgi:hypothetical protein
MIENQLIPDIIVQLNVEGKDVVKRLLPKRMEQWRKKMQLRKEKRTKNKGKKDRDKVWKRLFLILSLKIR